MSSLSNGKKENHLEKCREGIWDSSQQNSLPPKNMELENGVLSEEQLLLEGPMFLTSMIMGGRWRKGIEPPGIC